MKLMMKTKTDILLALIILALAVCGCDRHPDGVLSKEKMAHVLADLHKAEVVVETNTRTYNDSLRRVLRQSIYASNGVTSAEVDSSLKWYGYNMERYLDVYDRTIEILEKARDKARDKAGATTEQSTIGLTFEGDSVDVWSGERLRRWTLNMPSEIATFNVGVDNNSAEGDAYTLNVKLIGTTSAVDVNMTVEYRDGTFEFLSRQLNGNGWHQVRLATDVAKDARSVYGYISYKPKPDRTAYMDSVSLFRTRTGNPADVEARSQLKKYRPHSYNRY